MIGKWMMIIVAVVAAIAGIIAGLGYIIGPGPVIPDDPEPADFEADDASEIAAAFSSKYSGFFGNSFYLADGWSDSAAEAFYYNASTGRASETNNVKFYVLDSKDDAESRFDANKSAYSKQIGNNVMGSVIMGTYERDNLGDAIGYYNNFNMGTASTYLYYTGYLGNVFFESYMYLKGKTLADNDIKELAGGIYKAITNPAEVSEAKSLLPVRTDGRLMIYGNANMDDYLDDGDLYYLKKIISGEAAKTLYSDANQDGKVDQSDFDLVRKMIGGEKTEIYYHNLLTDKADRTHFPIKTIVPIVNETTVAMKILGKTSDFAGVYGVPDEKLFSDLPEGIPAFSSSGVIEMEVLSTLKCDAIVTMPVEKYVTNEEQIRESGIDVLRFDFRNPDCSSAYLTAGFILGAEERSQSYVEFADRVLSDIKEKVDAKYPDAQKVVAGVFGYNVIYGNINGYGNMVIGAGALNGVDWYEHRYVKDGYEWLYNYRFDWICGRVSAGGYDWTGSDADYETFLKSWNNHVKTYALTDALAANHLMLLNTSVPDLIKAVYMAEQFYPDIFGDGYADKIHQEYVDRFIDNLNDEGYKVTSGLFCMTSGDVKA
ncbi:MAG: ABC transporter substrate-binding protein [Candidatus Methanomethylophilaceae archaeon]|nr:ABC transporter substrate-binding protein [Candidatus Methanomethylophilaceae archaeon]